MKMEFDQKLFDTYMNALRGDFVMHMKDSILVYQAAIAAIEQGNFTDQQRADLCYLAHNYKGTGSSYGFVMVTKTAIVLEKKILLEPKCKDSDLAPLIQENLNSLLAAVEAHENAS